MDESGCLYFGKTMSPRERWGDTRWQSTKAGLGSKQWVLTYKPGILVRCADLKYTAAKLVKIGADTYLDIACRCLTCQESLL